MEPQNKASRYESRAKHPEKDGVKDNRRNNKWGVRRSLTRANSFLSTNLAEQIEKIDFTVQHSLILRTVVRIDYAVQTESKLSLMKFFDFIFSLAPIAKSIEMARINFKYVEITVFFSKIHDKNTIFCSTFELNRKLHC